MELKKLDVWFPAKEKDAEGTTWINGTFHKLEQVYVLTEIELLKIMWDYGNNCACDGASLLELQKPEQFIQSITK